MQNHKQYGKLLFPLEMNKESIHYRHVTLGNVDFIYSTMFSEKKIQNKSLALVSL